MSLKEKTADRSARILIAYVECLGRVELKVELPEAAQG
jgi:hypothetical protein